MKTLLNFILLISLLLSACSDGKPGMFSADGYHIGKDKVWYKTTTGMAVQVCEVTGADVASFREQEYVAKVTGEKTTFAVDKFNIYWCCSPIEGADLATFEYLFRGYGMDKNAVFFQNRLLTTDLSQISVVGARFLKDSRQVYFGGEVFSDDAAHFQHLGPDNSLYYKDSRKCWYDISMIKGADAATFQVLGPHTAADAYHIYHDMNEVEGADPKTYQEVAYDFSKDARAVYWKNVLLEGVNPATFRVLDENYYLDDKHCYYYQNLLAGADPKTFQLIDGFYAKDARQVYVNGKLIEGADPATFRVLNGKAGCSCDAKHAYTMEHRIEGANPGSFPASGSCQSCDEKGVQF